MSEVTCAVRGRLVMAADTDTDALTGSFLSQFVRNLKLPGDLPHHLREQYYCPVVLYLRQ